MKNKFGPSDVLEKAMAEALAAVERTEEKRKVDDADEAPSDAPAADDVPVELTPPVAAFSDAKVVPLADKASPAAEEIQVPREQFLRMAADFENFRKRSQRELDDMRKYGNERLLKDLLPVIDNLDRALAHAQSDKNPVIEGVRMVAKQAVEVLAGYGVKGFSAVGQPFDPERHEAVGQMPTSAHPPGAVAEEMLKGYKLHERLLRPAAVMVAVALPKAAMSDSGSVVTDNEGGAAQDKTAVRGDG